MGGYISINDTVLGQSILHKHYETTTSVMLGSGAGYKLVITNQDHQLPSNPPFKHTFWVDVPKGLQFKVIDVREYKGLFNNQLEITVEITNDIQPLSPTACVREAKGPFPSNTRFRSMDYRWRYTTVQECHNMYLNQIRNGSLLHIQGVTARLYFKDYDKDVPYTFDLQIRHNPINQEGNNNQ